jgi:hypothetical protein
MKKFYLLLLLTLTAPWALFSRAQLIAKMIPYYKGGKWGYCDSKGTILIKPYWDSAGFFAEGRALVKMKKEDAYSYCLIDENGDYIIPPTRNWNGRWSGKNGAELNALQDGYCGMIDTNNNEIIHFNYDAPYIAYKFCSGFVYRPDVEKWYLFESKGRKQGVIDDHNKILVPFKYENVYFPFNGASYYFYVNNGPMHTGAVDTNGNEVIPPRYYDVTFQERELPEGGYLKYLWVRTSNNGGSSYYLGWQNNPPPNFILDSLDAEYYAFGNFRLRKKIGKDYFELLDVNKNLVCATKFEWLSLSPLGHFIFKPKGSELWGLMDTTGKVIKAAKYKLIKYAGHGYYIFMPRNVMLCGIMNKDLKIVLEPSYEMIEFKRDSVKASRNFYNNVMDFSYKYLDPITFEPLTKWIFDTAAEIKYAADTTKIHESMEYFNRQNEWGGCGTGRREAARIEAEMDAYAQTHEHISKPLPSNNKQYYLRGNRNNETRIYEFFKDSLHYVIDKNVNAWPQYYSVKSDHNKNALNKKIYYAVVDTGFTYIIPPDTAYEVCYMNVAKKLCVIKKDSLFSFLDSNLKPAIPFQPYNIVSTFTLHGTLYAYGTKDTVDMSPYLRSLALNKIYTLYGYNRPAIDTVSNFHEKRRDAEIIAKTLLYKGAVVQALKDYRIIKLMPEDFGFDKACFLAKDLNNTWGLVDLDGKTLLGKLSFCYNEMLPVSNELFLVRRNGEAFYHLVNSNNKEIQKDLQVTNVLPEKVPAHLLNDKDLKVVKNIYRMYYQSPKGVNFVYVSGNGRVFADAPDLSN